MMSVNAYKLFEPLSHSEGVEWRHNINSTTRMSWAQRAAQRHETLAMETRPSKIGIKFSSAYFLNSCFIIFE